MPNPWLCPRCNRVAPGHMEFCPKCGEPDRRLPDPPPEKFTCREQGDRLERYTTGRVAKSA